jgi:hypothetical protein
VVQLGLAARLTAWMNTPTVRRRLDAATAIVPVGFGVQLAAESPTAVALCPPKAPCRAALFGF